MKRTHTHKRAAIFLLALVVFGIAALTLAKHYAKPPVVNMSYNLSQQQTNPLTKPTSPEPKTLNDTLAATNGWKWTLIGCGSQATCTYSVCAVNDAAKCYYCRNNSEQNDGAVIDRSSINPETTKLYTCAKA